MFKIISTVSEKIVLKLDELHLLKIARFVVSGSVAAGVNLFVLFMLVHFGQMYYLTASITAVIIATIVNFLLQKFWTFENKDTKETHTQLIKFSTVAGINLGINTGLLYLFVSIFGIWYLAAQVIAATLIAFISYLGYKMFVFSQQ